MINTLATWLNVMKRNQQNRIVLHTQNPANNNKKLFIEHGNRKELKLPETKHIPHRTEAIKYPV